MKDLSEFEAYLKNRRSPCTVKAYLWSMSKYFAQSSGDVTKDSIRAYVRHLESVNTSPQTIKRHVAAIKYYLKYIDKSELMPNIELPRSNPAKTKPLTKEQLEKLLEACNTLQERVIISMMYGLALRAGELLRMKVEDFCDREGMVSIHTEKQRTFEDIVDEIPISDELFELVSEYILDSGIETGLLFKNMTYKALLDMVQDLCKRAGIPSVGTHVFRHTIASNLASHKIDIYSLQSFMRHRSIASTIIYTHTKSDTVKKAVEDALRD